jgi:hypothetical protein
MIIKVDITGRIARLSRDILYEHLRLPDVQNKGSSGSSSAPSVKTLDIDGVSCLAPIGTGDYDRYSQSLRAAWADMR